MFKDFQPDAIPVIIGPSGVPTAGIWESSPPSNASGKKFTHVSNRDRKRTAEKDLTPELPAKAIPSLARVCTSC